MPDTEDNAPAANEGGEETAKTDNTEKEEAKTDNDAENKEAAAEESKEDAAQTEDDDAKRKREEEGAEKPEGESDAKKAKTGDGEDAAAGETKEAPQGATEAPSGVPAAAAAAVTSPPAAPALLPTNPDGPEPAPVLPSKEGISVFADQDVLSGRGGGTNVHPGNRNFRDLINLHRRAYLKARKNDKPAISRAIVRSVRESNGRFLKKDDKSGLWFEIGDDAAREKTSQALRQRAPEMRKLLFDTEREEARAAAEEHLRQQRMMMGMPNMSPEMMANMAANMPPMPMGPGGAPMFPNPAAMMAMAKQAGMPMPPEGAFMYPGFFPGTMPPKPPDANGNGDAPAPAGDSSAPAPAAVEGEAAATDAAPDAAKAPADQGEQGEAAPPDADAAAQAEAAAPAAETAAGNEEAAKAADV